VPPLLHGLIVYFLKVYFTMQNDFRLWQYPSDCWLMTISQFNVEKTFKKQFFNYIFGLHQLI